jgi:hypothetical protein
MYIRMPVGLGVVVTVMTVTVPVTFAAVGERHDPTAEVAALDARYQAAVKARADRQELPALAADPGRGGGAGDQPGSVHATQLWELVSTGDGRYELLNIAAELCIADPGWSWDDWTQLQIQTCRNSAKSCSC